MNSLWIFAIIAVLASSSALAEGVAAQPALPAEAPVYRPLPILASGAESPILSLCGTWEFRVNPAETFYTSPAKEVSGVANIEVPGEWLMQGFTVPKNQPAGYRRSFTLPEGWRSGRVIIRADSIFSDCKLWINGKQAGGHLGGFTPFERDITDLVKPGVNHIGLSVRSESIADSLATASKYAVHPLGGITRKIRLFAVPATHVAMLAVSTDLDASFKNATVTTRASLRNDSTSEAKVSCKLDIAA